MLPVFEFEMESRPGGVAEGRSQKGCGEEVRPDPGFRQPDLVRQLGRFDRGQAARRWRASRRSRRKCPNPTIRPLSSSHNLSPIVRTLSHMVSVTTF